MTMLAFHDDPAIKAKYVNRMKDHIAADQVIQKLSWEEETNSGCAVGCTLNSYSHEAYEEELGIPEALARLEDSIFEGLPVRDAPAFALGFLTAIHPGADLSMVTSRMCHWMLTSPDLDLQGKATEAGRSAIVTVATLYSQRIAGNEPSDTEWSSARSAAWTKIAGNLLVF